ncbi:MAG: hypothetical protein J7K95_01660 [Thermoplasmata archaeon]|nr:hypothetical protein [Thermoplasmata archaeon]
MDRKTLLKAIFVISLLYFIWLIMAVANETFWSYNLYLSFKTWSIIGIIAYAAFIIIEVLLYITAPKEEEEEIKIVSEAIKKIVCSNCKTVFTIRDTGVRPLKYKCPNCGMEGVLRGKSVKGKRLAIECDKCGNEFEIFDTGERPLKYKCPVCHYQGVLS